MRTLLEGQCICREFNCPIGIGFCHCGCGRNTTIAPNSNGPAGKTITGLPYLFARGHGKIISTRLKRDGCVCKNSSCQIPFGFCHCGCGEKAPIAKQTRSERNQLAGKPCEFVRGHIINKNRPSHRDRIHTPTGTCVCGAKFCAITRGYCHCGCGNLTPISDYSCNRLGYVIGEPRKFIPHHDRHTKRLSREDRFWPKVNKSGKIMYEYLGQCWEWTSYLTSAGYGQFGPEKNKNGEYKNRYAHQISWEIANNKLIPKGLFVLHKCDNPRCVNPDHLYVGTQQENVRDAVQRHRIRSGERHPLAKLTNDNVREILSRHYQYNETQAKIASSYGVSVAVVKQIVQNRNWLEIPRPERIQWPQ